MGLMKLISFCTAKKKKKKKNHEENDKKTSGWEKILANDVTDKS